ncbi:ribosomal P2 [Pyrenophora seminiperda CCB06]|uniref:Ribosomal P2 n=1 Tax=Pyrenophora seminiperda CCB06 TaxID=1302712 RepID=A0A3M7LYA7_9PLEO|nr:ribosomal P2 [Pyrenophora seminiperda CCB06]
MTTNRPFFGTFLAAFRAQQPNLQKAATSQAASVASYPPNNTAQQNPALDNAATSRTITTKTRSPSPGATTVSVQATGHFQPTRQHAAPYNRSTSPKAKAFPIPGATQRSRRGSDSSSEGFHEAMGAEKWYIGGRTATGEEKFYKLGMVKRHRSADRLSVDKLSI